MGDDGAFQAIVCKLKRGDEDMQKNLATALLDLIKNKKILPTLDDFVCFFNLVMIYFIYLFV